LEGHVPAREVRRLLRERPTTIVLAFVTPTTLGGQFAAFLWFRFFDMVKPAPIRYYDRTLKGFGVRGGYGVMVDDILAAFYTLLVFALWRSF
ncbi:MAG: phosphatidylglycerophosphatase A, partial [Ralstonia pickettii]|nr:phosphatidylglycerophosphatase A [Ralstonia pickettii]